MTAGDTDRESHPIPSETQGAWWVRGEATSKWTKKRLKKNERVKGHENLLVESTAYSLTLFSLFYIYF